MRFLPSVVHAEHREGFRLHIVFNDGSENTVDFRAWLEGPMFEPLKDLKYFQRFFIDGGTVVWPNGADIPPETLYDVAGRRRKSKARVTAKAGHRRLGARRRKSRPRG